MRKLDTDPKDPFAVLDQLAAEREALLARINGPIGRLAARAAAVIGQGPLALNTWMTNYTRKKAATK
ncbi:MAG: hypothetical protein ACM3KF_03110 [Acidobacteriota bacterium]